MKSIVSILLLVLVLTGIAGQRCATWLAVQQADEAIAAHIDAHQYHDSQLVTVKVPVSLPYQNNWASPERVDGEINYKGKHFRYVSRQLVNDTMVLQCIAHTAKTEIRQQQAQNLLGYSLPGKEKSAPEIAFHFTQDFDDLLVTRPLLSATGSDASLAMQCTKPGSMYRYLFASTLLRPPLAA